MALIVHNIVIATAGIVIAFTANWILAFIVLVVITLIFLQGYLQAKFMKGFNADAKVTSNNLAFLLQKSFRSI